MVYLITTDIRNNKRVITMTVRINKKHLGKNRKLSNIAVNCAKDNLAKYLEEYINGVLYDTPQQAKTQGEKT